MMHTPPSTSSSSLASLTSQSAVSSPESPASTFTISSSTTTLTSSPFTATHPQPHSQPAAQSSSTSATSAPRTSSTTTAVAPLANYSAALLAAEDLLRRTTADAHTTRSRAASLHNSAHTAAQRASTLQAQAQRERDWAARLARVAERGEGEARIAEEAMRRADALLIELRKVTMEQITAAVSKPGSGSLDLALYPPNEGSQPVPQEQGHSDFPQALPGVGASEAIGATELSQLNAWPQGAGTHSRDRTITPGTLFSPTSDLDAILRQEQERLADAAALHPAEEQQDLQHSPGGRRYEQISSRAGEAPLRRATVDTASLVTSTHDVSRAGDTSYMLQAHTSASAPTIPVSPRSFPLTPHIDPQASPQPALSRSAQLELPPLCSPPPGSASIAPSSALMTTTAAASSASISAASALLQTVVHARPRRSPPGEAAREQYIDDDDGLAAQIEAFGVGSGEVSVGDGRSMLALDPIWLRPRSDYEVLPPPPQRDETADEDGRERDARASMARGQRDDGRQADVERSAPSMRPPSTASSAYEIAADSASLHSSASAYLSLDYPQPGVVERSTALGLEGMFAASSVNAMSSSMGSIALSPSRRTTELPPTPRFGTVSLLPAPIHSASLSAESKEGRPSTPPRPHRRFQGLGASPDHIAGKERSPATSTPSPSSRASVSGAWWKHDSPSTRGGGGGGATTPGGFEEGQVDPLIPFSVATSELMPVPVQVAAPVVTTAVAPAGTMHAGTTSSVTPTE